MRETDQPAADKVNLPVIAVVVLGTFMAILDSTIVNVALPRMISIFNSSPDHAQWIVTAYMLVLGIIMPVSGFLGDRFGYKRMYILALGLFTLGSCLCGFAWSVNSLIVFRVIQALGGGIMQPLGMAILYQNNPRSRMGMVLGIWGIAAMLAPALGPTLGGYLVDYASWRFIFYINIPVGTINLFMAARILKETSLITTHHLDVVGILTSTSGFFCLLLALSQVGKYGWHSPFIVGLLYAALLSFIILTFNELKHPEPMLDLRLFTNFTFTLSVIISCINFMGMFAVVFLIPILLQSVVGLTAMRTGLIMFPAAFASGLVMPFSGRIFDRYGARGTVILGLAILTWTTWQIGKFDAQTSFFTMTIWLTARGLGMGFAMMPATTAGMNTVPPHLVGRASALNNAIRQVSSAFAIAAFASLFQSRQAMHFADLAVAANLSGPEFERMQQAMQGLSTSLGQGAGFQHGMTIGMLSGQLAKLSLIQAINDCFIIAAGLCLLGLFLAFFLGSSPGKKAASQTAPVKSGADIPA